MQSGFAIGLGVGGGAPADLFRWVLSEQINGASVNVSWVGVLNLPAAAFSKSFNMAAFVFADKSVPFLTAMHNTWAILRRYEPGKKKLWIEDCNGRVRSVYVLLGGF